MKLVPDQVKELPDLRQICPVDPDELIEKLAASPVHLVILLDRFTPAEEQVTVIVLVVVQFLLFL